MTLTTQARPQVLTKQETDQTLEATPAKAEKKSGISIELKVHIDKDVVTDAMAQIPGIIQKAGPEIQKMLPDLTDAAVKLIAALGPEAHKIIASGMSSAVSRMGALTTTALSSAKEAALAPVRGARDMAVNAALAPFKLGAKILFGG